MLAIWAIISALALVNFLALVGLALTEDSFRRHVHQIGDGNAPVWCAAALIEEYGSAYSGVRVTDVRFVAGHTLEGEFEPIEGTGPTGTVRCTYERGGRLLGRLDVTEVEVVR